MAFGKPSIGTPGKLDLRALQTAIGNTRERIEAIEAALATAQSSIIATQSSTSASASAAQLASLQSQITALAARVSILENITFEDGLNELPVSSGADLQGFVPVSVDGTAVLMLLSDIAAAISNLEALISLLPYSSNVDPNAEVPVVIGGVAVRVNAGDIARLLFTASVSSGAASSMLVPVEYAGQLLLVTAGDIAALAGGSANLQALIDALSASSGAEASAEIPGTLGGTAYRYNAFDIANLLMTHPSYSSGAERNALVPVRLADGTTVLVTAGDIAALASTDLVSAIDAFSALSGAEANAQVPAVLNGTTGVRLTAFDIANLLMTHSPYSSGIEHDALVPVRLANGMTVLVTAADIASLASGSITVQNVSGGTTGAATTLVVPNALLSSVAANIATMRVASVFTLTDAATIAIDASAASSFRVTLGGSRTLQNPTNLTSGQIFVTRVVQDATGSRTLLYDTKYKFGTDGAPTLSTVGGVEDLMMWQYDATDDTVILIRFVKGVNSTGTIDAFATSLWFAGGITKLISTATKAIRVRRTSDNVEQDIGFASDGSLDTASLTTFLGANSGTVKIIYDQSGGGAGDLTQATTTKQPKIYTAGVYLGKISFDGVDDFYQTPNNWDNTKNGVTSFIRGTLTSTAATVVLLELGTNYTVTQPAFIFDWDTTGTRLQVGAGSGGSTNHNDFSSTLTSCVACARTDNAAVTMADQDCFFLNGVRQTATVVSGTVRTGNFTAQPVYFFSRAGTSIFAPVDLQKLVMYKTALTDANVTAISALL